MIIVLNGPLGIGKSTLAEALMESVDGCVMLDGDQLIAINPAPDDELRYLHATIALLVAHHRRSGYEHFVINHLWQSAEELNDLRNTLGESDRDFRCFLLTLPLEENLRRILSRQAARAIDELEFELATAAEERALLESTPGLGERFDVSGRPEELVLRLLDRIGWVKSEE